MLSKLKDSLKFLMIILGLGFITLGPFCMSYAQSTHTEDSNDDLEESLSKQRTESRDVVERIQRTYGDNVKNNSSQLFISPEELLPIIRKVNHAYSSMSYETARKHIGNNISTTPVSSVVYKFPKIVDFITHLLRHDRAMTGLVKMFEDKTKLLYFFIANVLTIVLGFILRKMMNKKVGFFRRVLRWFFRKTFIYSIRICILIFFFGTELEPTFNIFKEVFLN